jgi:hypothetical protein
MTNDEIRMTKRGSRHSSFVLRHSLVIRASSFVISRRRERQRPRVREEPPRRVSWPSGVAGSLRTFGRRRYDKRTLRDRRRSAERPVNVLARRWSFLGVPRTLHRSENTMNSIFWSFVLLSVVCIPVARGEKWSTRPDDRVPDIEEMIRLEGSPNERASLYLILTNADPKVRAPDGWAPRAAHALGRAIQWRQRLGSDVGIVLGVRSAPGSTSVTYTGFSLDQIRDIASLDAVRAAQELGRHDWGGNFGLGTARPRVDDALPLAQLMPAEDGPGVLYLAAMKRDPGMGAADLWTPLLRAARERAAMLQKAGEIATVFLITHERRIDIIPVGAELSMEKLSALAAATPEQARQMLGELRWKPIPPWFTPGGTTRPATRPAHRDEGGGGMINERCVIAEGPQNAR